MVALENAEKVETNRRKKRHISTAINGLLSKAKKLDEEAKQLGVKEEDLHNYQQIADAETVFFLVTVMTSGTKGQAVVCEDHYTTHSPEHQRELDAVATSLGHNRKHKTHPELGQHSDTPLVD
ncbi:hypothetical protein BH09PAT2_BH09PAT2_04070 [soil metagenome]